MHHSGDELKQELVSLSYLTVYLDSENNWLENDWSGVLSADRARQGCLAIIECLQKYQVPKILNNNSQVTGHYPGAIEWVGQVWFPSMYRQGVRYFAWVYSPAFYTQVSTDKIISLSSKVEIRTFFDVESARLWLQEQKT